jgi:DNA recombination protein RmuC
MDPNTSLSGLLIGLPIGAVLVWLLLRSRHRAEQAESLAELRERELIEARAAWETTRDQLDASRDDTARLEERARRVPELEQRLGERETELSRLRVEHTALLGQLQAANARVEAEQARAAEKLALLTQTQAALSERFRLLAAEALETSTSRLQAQSQAALGSLLEPLRQRLSDFQKKVEEVYVDESKERSALRQQVEGLLQLNRTLSDDARNLTAALRGSAKSQGNWGELILERVLEASGLRKGHEYVVQDAQRNEDGERQQPDVVIHLPESRRLVVDAKVSLVAYERLTSAEDEGAREAALREHLGSVRAHLRGLSEKRYQALYGQLDFVLMFVPIEPAFMAAVTHDQQLFMDAWERNVLLVSPSTLLFVVRTVAHLWRQEAQGRNAQEIAKRGAELYDRLTGFVADLDAVGTRLDGARQAWSDARKKLGEGRGNVIRQAEMLRELGVKPSKQLPRALVEEAGSPTPGEPDGQP